MESRVNRNEDGGLCSADYAVFKWLNNVNFISGEKWLKLVYLLLNDSSQSSTLIQNFGWLYSFIRVLICQFLHSIDMHGLKTEWGLEP